MGLQLAIFSKPDSGELLLDATPFVTSCKPSTNKHGVEAINVTVDRTLYDAFRIYNAPGTLHVVLSNGAGPIAVGRLEEPGLSVGNTNELSLNALGYWRALSDVLYTALWSDTRWDRWRPVANTELTNRTPERYDFRTENNVLEIAPKKGETFGGHAGPAPQPAIGSYLYVPPLGGSRQITLVQFDLELNVPSGWRFICYGLNSTFSSFTLVYPLASAGALLKRSVFTSLTANDRLMFDLYLDTPGTIVAGFDSGTVYARISNIRVCTTLANIANTTLTANRAAGTSVTATVGSTANMYVGQRLTINSGGNPSESVIVQSVSSPTQFVATFVNGYTSGQPVGGANVYADEVIRDLVSIVNATNPTQLQSSTALIQSPTRDMPDLVFEDADMGDIATTLATSGRQASAPYDVGVDLARRLYFRPRGNQARTWYVAIDDLAITRSLDGMYNSVYAIYQDASGTTVRSASSTDSTSVQRYGITRRKGVSVQSADATYAANVRDAALVDDALVEPRATYTLSQVFGQNGALVPLWFVTAGDYLILRNLPPAVSTSLDTVRMFRITRTEYDPLSETLAIEPEAPLPTLDALLAQQV